MKIFIRIAFLGKDFYGTQRQKKERTLQGDFEEALSLIYNEDVKVTISSRLDRGVSALDFGLTFDTDKEMNLEHLSYFLQRRLGREVLIKDVREVGKDFSPRYSCLYKEYLYLIQLPEHRNPLLNPISFVPIDGFDEEKMKEALSLFVGRHDYRFFATPEGEENTLLEVDEIKTEIKKGLLYIRFKAKSFLRYQIRFMVGASLQYVYGKLTLDAIARLLEGENLKYPKLRAEPQGLLLEHIEYPSVKEEKQKNTFASILFEY